MAIIPISSENDILAWLDTDSSGGVYLKMRRALSDEPISILRIDRQGLWVFSGVDETLGLPLDNDSAVTIMGTLS